MKTKVNPTAENEVELSVEVPAEAVRKAYDRTVAKVRDEMQLPGFRKGRVPVESRDPARRRRLHPRRDARGRDPRVGRRRPARGRPLRRRRRHLRPPGRPARRERRLQLLAQGADHADAHPRRVQGSRGPQARGRGHRRAGRGPARHAAGAARQAAAGRGPRRADRRLRAHGPRGLPGRRAHRGRPGQGPDVRGRPRQSHPRLRGGARRRRSAARRSRFDVTFPDDYQAEELAGQPATFKVTVKEIKEKVVPELDDAFAADVSEFETLDELRADVRARLEAAAEAGAQREFRAAAVDKAVANATVGGARRR